MGRAIIDGRRYNTETATCVAGIGSRSGVTPRDWGYFDGTLYRTPRGNYFVEGRGGPQSLFGVSAGSHGSQGSAGIVPVTEESAMGLVAAGQFGVPRAEVDETMEMFFGHLIETA